NEREKNKQEEDPGGGEWELGKAVARQAAEEEVPHHDRHSHEGAVEEIDGEGSPREGVGVVRPLRLPGNPSDGQLEDLGSRLERRGNHPKARKEHHPYGKDGEKCQELSPVARQRRLTHSTPPLRKRRS